MRGSSGTGHDLIDNCGGVPVRLQETFDYRPGAARVGGDIVLCGASPGEREGVWEVLEDGSAGQDLGLGRGCLNRADASDRRTEAPAAGFVWDDSGWAQHLPSGTVRALPFPGTLTRVGDTWLVRGDGRLEPEPEPEYAIEPDPEPEPDGEGKGQVALLGPNGVDAVVLNLPDRIADIVSPSDASPWVILVPEFDGLDAKPLYALDTTHGSWFNTGPVSPDLDLHQVSVRDGLAVTRASEYGPVEFMRPQWDAPLPTDLDKDDSITVIDAEHVLVVDRDVRLLRVPLDAPGDNEAAYEVQWEYELQTGHSLNQTDPGMVWNGLALFPYRDETWAFPLDGSNPYPFLPRGVGSIYFGTEFVTAMVGSDPNMNRRLIRAARGRPREVIADGVDDFGQRGWTPELGRILYTVRDYGGVSIYQHRLND